MPTTRKTLRYRVTIPNRSLITRAHDLMERAFSHLNRKPDSLYDVRKQKAAPFPVRHVEDYRKAMEQGADHGCLMDAHELVAVEAESMFADDPSHISGRLNLTLEEAYEAEFEAECDANLAQLIAIRTGSRADKERALSKTLAEIRTLKQYARVLKRDLDSYALAERHVS